MTGRASKRKQPPNKIMFLSTAKAVLIDMGAEQPWFVMFMSLALYLYEEKDAQ